MNDVGLIEVAFWSLMGGAISLALGGVILTNKRIAKDVGKYAVPFAAGALLGATFFELLPEAVEVNDPRSVFFYTALAIVIFFLLERYLHRFHFHDKETVKIGNRATTPLILIGDAVHNALDGIVIGAAFLINAPVGIVTTIAVSAHEIPRKTGDVGVLLKQGMERLRVLGWNAAATTTTLIAALATFGLGSGENLPVGLVLGFSAGLLIYVAMSDLIPTIHDEAKAKFAAVPALLLIVGIIVVASASNLAHEYIEEDHANSNETSEHQEEDNHPE